MALNLNMVRIFNHKGGLSVHYLSNALRLEGENPESVFLPTTMRGTPRPLRRSYSRFARDDFSMSYSMKAILFLRINVLAFLQ